MLKCRRADDSAHSPRPQTTSKRCGHILRFYSINLPCAEQYASQLTVLCQIRHDSVRVRVTKYCIIRIDQSLISLTHFGGTPKTVLNRPCAEFVCPWMVYHQVLSKSAAAATAAQVVDCAFAQFD